MKTVTGLFDTYSDAEAAVSKLEAAGIASSDISIVSNNGDGRGQFELGLRHASQRKIAA